MRIRSVTAVAVTIALTAACSGTGANPKTPITPGASRTTSPSKAAALLAKMSTKDKVGQLFMPVLYGAGAGTKNGRNPGGGSPLETVRKYRLGGVIYFDWAGNIESARQVATLSNDLQKGAKTSLLISADQETGLVARLDKIATRMPGNMATGATGSAELGRKAAKATGEELRSLGIGLNLAPVADVNVDPGNPVIGVRSYGSRPKRVAEMVGGAVDGFHDAGVAAAAKHFPGHGDTSVDSHVGLPMIENAKSKWAKQDRPPFDEAIEHDVDAIMTAHIVMPKLDSSRRPATLSKPILTGLLRREMGFDGVVITDGLQMEGVRTFGGRDPRRGGRVNTVGDGEVAVRAVEAGADVLLMPPDLPKAHDAVMKAVRTKRISGKRLDESVARILRLKEKRGLLPPSDASGRGLRSKGHEKVARQVADRSVTLVAGDVKVVRRGGRVAVVGSPSGRLSKELKARGIRVVANPRDADLVVTISKGTPRPPSTGKAVIGVGTGLPYGLARQSGLTAALATYSPSAASMRSVARVLTGEIAPKGRLPVALD